MSAAYATVAAVAARRARATPTSCTRPRWPDPSAAARNGACTRSRCTTCCGATSRALDAGRHPLPRAATASLIASREDLRIIVTSPSLGERLVDVGIDAPRVHAVRLGVDDDVVQAASHARVAALLAEHGVRGPFTLYAGTREPRKNLERLIEAHRSPSASHAANSARWCSSGPSGWGDVATADAVGARHGDAPDVERPLPRRDGHRVRAARRGLGTATRRGPARGYAGRGE